jgi:hypothetical protein
VADDLEAVLSIELTGARVVLAHGQHHGVRERQDVLEQATAGAATLACRVYAETEKVKEFAVSPHDSVGAQRLAVHEHPAHGELALEHCAAHRVLGEEHGLKRADAFDIDECGTTNHEVRITRSVESEQC